jgi:hypothetical protein
MKRITEIPNLSKEMQRIYDKFWEVHGNFKALMPHIDDFLEKYPIYPEALVLKARALMAIGRNNEALSRSLKNLSLAGTASSGSFAICCCCLLYTSPSPRDRTRSRMPSSA